jgi:DNA-binding NarL/FixJ family response regulator
VSLRIAIVDDQHLVRAGFSMILDAEPDLEVVGEAGDGIAGVDLIRREAPDVALMDVRMPHKDGIEATRELLGEGVATRIVILTTFDLDEYVFAALRAGASGFLLKDTPPEQLVAAVRTVAAGEALLSPSITARVIAAFAEGAVAPPSREGAEALEGLTHREREVLGLLARGRANAEIATELFVSETTVKTHVGRVLAKLGLRDRVQAVIFAYEHGLVRVGHG